MMKSFRPLLASLLVGAFLSCERQEADVPVSLDGELFYASLEQPVDAETKVYADENLMVLWHSDDRVSIFDRYTYNREYRFTGETGDNSGAFQKVPSDDFVTGNEIPNVYAVYPYQASTRISNAQVLTLTLPSEQTYAFRSFGRGANTMVSATEDKNLLFKNVGGYLVLKLYGEGVYVTSLTLKGNADEPLAGKAVVTAPVGGIPSVEMQADASREITLTCPEPVALGATSEDYTEFWFVLPPTSFTDGFTVTVTGGKGDRFKKSTGNAVTVKRNDISRMAPLKVNLEPGFDTLPVGNVPDVADGSTVHVRGLVSAMATRAFVISEDDSHILVYTGPGAMNCSLGDIVTVSGTKATYRGVAEITSPDLSISVESSGNELPDLEYQDITESFDTFSAGCAVPVCFRGILTKSGTQYNITVEEASRTGYIYWPVAGFVNEDLVGTSVLAKGFFQGLYSYTTGDYLDIVATGIETAGQPDNEIWYTSTDGKVVEPRNPGVLNVGIISNTYENGKGIIRLDGDLTRIGEKKSAYSAATDSFFYMSSTLASVSLPNSLRTIAYFSFYICNNLTTVHLPDKLEYLGSTSFYTCGLLSVNVPETTEIAGDPFVRCSKIDQFSGPYASSDGKCLIKDKTLYSFAEDGLVRYVVPDGIEVIGDEVFYGCLQIESVTLPGSVTTIGNNAFADCAAMRSIQLPDRIERIGAAAFCRSGLTEVSLPESLQQLGHGAFCDSPYLQRVSFSEEIPRIKDNPFYGCPELLGFYGTYASEDHRALVKDGVLISAALSGISSYEVGSDVNEIGNYAFYRASHLSNLIIPSSISRIGVFAVYDCAEMESVTILSRDVPSGSNYMFDKANPFPLYAPAQSVEAYKIAQYWSDYADRIFPIEETVNGGTEGTGVEIWD